jgi:hypothetical protein
MSRTLSMKSGSRLSLKVSERCGASEKARQMRLIVDWLRPVAGRPVRGSLRLAFQRARQHLLDLLVAQLARSSRTRFVQQTVKTLIDKPLPPFARRRQRATLPASDLRVAQPIGGQKHDPRAHRQCLRRLRSSRPRLQLLALLRAESEWN